MYYFLEWNLNSGEIAFVLKGISILQCVASQPFIITPEKWFWKAFEKEFLQDFFIIHLINKTSRKWIFLKRKLFHFTAELEKIYLPSNRATRQTTCKFILLLFGQSLINKLWALPSRCPPLALPRGALNAMWKTDSWWKSEKAIRRMIKNYL